MDANKTLRVSANAGSISICVMALQIDSVISTPFLAGPISSPDQRKVTQIAATVDTLGLINSPVDLRFRAGLSWSQGKNGASLFANYTMITSTTAVTPAERVAERVGTLMTYDLTMRRDIGKQARLSLAVQNLFDQDPPYVRNVYSTSSLGAVGYDPQQASAIGRFVSLTLTKRW